MFQYNAIELIRIYLVKFGSSRSTPATKLHLVGSRLQVFSFFRIISSSYDFPPGTQI